MADIVLDTNIAADFLAIYYKNKVNIDGLFSPQNRINNNLSKRINNIISEYRFGESIFSKGLVIMSSFAFVEIARQFDIISHNRFSLEQFQAFVEAPPEWVSIEPLHPDLFSYFLQIPEKVIEEDMTENPVEWSDAIHIATTLSRGPNAILYTGDTVIPKINLFKERIVQL